MNIERRIDAFVLLGDRMLAELDEHSTLDFTIAQAGVLNPWFTKGCVENAIRSIAARWLNYESINSWLSTYNFAQLTPKKPKRVGVIMAGNVPLVGFHDMLCVLMSGNRFIGKFSSKDSCLMGAIVQMLVKIEPELDDFIEITENQLKNFEAVIATGSNSTSRYFDFYFRNYPSIIRKHRNSIAVLTGNESDDDLERLSNDIFMYFGLGCRNVSKVFVPQKYNMVPLLDSFSKWKCAINHNKYANNYEYSRAIFAMNQVKHLDTGYLLVTESDRIESAVGVLNYQRYNDISEVSDFIRLNADRIQCVVGNSGACAGEIAFGEAQNPQIADYADGVDTMNFLIGLNGTQS